MENVNNCVEPSCMAAQILDKTHYGIGIYAHILRLYYPGQTVLSLSGRTCSPTKNPFNADKPTLNIFIYKEHILGNVLDREFARHEDNQNAILVGNAFDFAELHYKQSGDKLFRILNEEMSLHIGKQWNFYIKNQKNIEISLKHQAQSPPVGEPTVFRSQEEKLGGCFFSFFKAPVRNTIPHKSIFLLDAYNYIVGDYAKQRTEKLRSILSPLFCGEGSGERLKQARQYKASTFDYCTFSGMFQTRNDKALISHSGLLCVDFDHLQSVNLLRDQLLHDEYFETQLLFVSPSGDGLKWIISIDANQTSHGENLNEREQNSNPFGVMPSEVKFAHSEFFAAVANYILQTYGIAVDKSGRDISRACFLPYDPQAFINPVYLK
ncbi:MAG: BT4734/BF3469 family protein [Massilibacteroides sp.]|nr:BT4734/BF3469 family protein [Massilibacteroides sp.]